MHIEYKVMVDSNTSGFKEVRALMYPFLTLDDEAEIVHSELLDDGQIKVYVEKPDEQDCFHHATCYLPAYAWTDVFGFSGEELARYEEVIRSTAHLIFRFAQQGGIENAAGL